MEDADAAEDVHPVAPGDRPQEPSEVVGDDVPSELVTDPAVVSDPGTDNPHEDSPSGQ